MTARPFRLSDADFAALGAGRPSPATLDVLRRAQLSRTLLLLREIGRALPTTPHWYARLLTADPAQELITDPMTALWAAHTLREGHAPPPAPGGHQITLTDQNQTLSVRVDDADPLRRLLGLEPAGPLTTTSLQHWQHCLEQAWRILARRHPAAATTLAAVLRVIVPVRPDPSVEGISATSAEAFGAVAMSMPADGPALATGLLHETQHSVLNAANLLFELVEPGGPRGYSPWRDDPRPAFGVLHGAYAYLAVTRFWRTEHARLRSREQAERTGHAPFEAQEQAKRTGHTPLEAREQAERTGHTPLEAQEQAKRTPHEAREQASEARGTAALRAAAFEFARWRVAVVEAAEGLLAGGELTVAGTRFVTALLEEARPWLAEPVEPEAARLAALAGDDHRLRWRLRNLTVAEADATELGRAWRAGRRPPLVASVAAPGSGRVLANSARLRLVRALLKGDPAGRPGGRATVADLACLRGSYRTAAHAYQSELEGDRNDDHAWSGLALVSPRPALRRRPEVVKAAALAAPEADVDALAAWLSGSATESLAE